MKGRQPFQLEILTYRPGETMAAGRALLQLPLREAAKRLQDRSALRCPSLLRGVGEKMQERALRLEFCGHRAEEVRPLRTLCDLRISLAFVVAEQVCAAASAGLSPIMGMLRS